MDRIERYYDFLEKCNARGYHHTDAVTERLSLIASVLIDILETLEPHTTKEQAHEG